MLSEIRVRRSDADDWEAISVPSDLTDGFPENPVQGCWDLLVADFVRDIRGEAHAPYPTFHDGWVATALIDIARDRSGWQELDDPR